MTTEATPNPPAGNAAGSPPANTPATTVAAPAAADTPSLASVAADTPERPEWLPEEYWDAEKNAIKGDDIAARLKPPEDLVTKLEDIDWSVKLPDDHPLGVKEVGFDPEDPRVQEVGKVLANAGLTKVQIGSVLNAYAMGEAARLAGLKEHLVSEMKALGEKAPTRIKSVTNWLTDNVGQDRATRLLAKLTDASDIEAIEALIEKSQGPQPSPSAGSPVSKPKSAAALFYGNDPFKQ